MNITITYFADFALTGRICRIISSYDVEAFSYNSSLQASYATIDAEGINQHCLKELEEALADTGARFKVIK